MKKKEYGLKRKSRTTACEGSVLEFCRDTMELPDGKVEQWDFVHHKKGGGACTVPVLPDGRILMIRQYRPSVERETLELPAGARNRSDEDPMEAAVRELAEETGYQAGRVRFLTRLKTAVAWCDEETFVYLAEDLTPAAGQHLDEAEEIGVEAHSLSELLDLIFEGRLQDAKTVAGILAFASCEGHQDLRVKDPSVQ